MKMIVFYLIVLFFTIKCDNHAPTKDIDLFSYGKEQSFDISDTDFNKNLKDLENTLLTNTIDNKLINLDRNSTKKNAVVLNDLKGLIEKYIQLKSNKDNKEAKHNNLSSSSNSLSDQQNSIDFNKMRFKSKITNEAMNNNKKTNLQTHPNKNIKVKMFPFNIIINKPDVIVNNPHKQIYLDNRLFDKPLEIESGKKKGKKVVMRSIPIDDCNKTWDYKLHGEDWDCMVR